MSIQIVTNQCNPDINYINKLELATKTLEISLGSDIVSMCSQIHNLKFKVIAESNGRFMPNRIAMCKSLYYLLSHEYRNSFLSTQSGGAFNSTFDELFGLKIIIRDDFKLDQVDIYYEEEIDNYARFY